jgi:hypothetical protein
MMINPLEVESTLLACLLMLIMISHDRKRPKKNGGRRAMKKSTFGPRGAGLLLSHYILWDDHNRSHIWLAELWGWGAFAEIQNTYIIIYYFTRR